MGVGKHVIFLGAGASCGSGYPVANGLRLLISSRHNWQKALAKYEDKHNVKEARLQKVGLDFWDKHKDALDLFRSGGFGTLDEFCKLAGGFSFQDEINNLRIVLRAALGLFNPEEQFEKSEYYSFVQNLFNDDLQTLRDDITVLTYNYDPYLEYLLYRALEVRHKVRRKGRSAAIDAEEAGKIGAHQRRLNAVTSGMNLISEHGWLGDQNSFCVLQLHGSIASPVDSVADYEQLFTASVEHRAMSLFMDNAAQIIPPVVFPWEVITSNGFVEKDTFPFRNHPVLKNLFRGIWERAQRDVQAAKKISFVGLSMHEYLFDGLKYLFKDKSGQAEVVIANPDNTGFAPIGSGPDWSRISYSPGRVVSDLLSDVAKNMVRMGVRDGRPPGSGDVTLIRDFDSFIKTQMKPVVEKAS
jgi:hypothetical protein